MHRTNIHIFRHVALPFTAVIFTSQIYSSLNIYVISSKIPYSQITHIILVYTMCKDWERVNLILKTESWVNCGLTYL